MATLTRRIDYANNHHRLAVEALEASKKEKEELRQKVKAQVKEINSLMAEVKVTRETAMQHFIDHFKKHPLYDTFCQLLGLVEHPSNAGVAERGSSNPRHIYTRGRVRRTYWRSAKHCNY